MAASLDVCVSDLRAASPSSGRRSPSTPSKTAVGGFRNRRPSAVTPDAAWTNPASSRTETPCAGVAGSQKHAHGGHSVDKDLWTGTSRCSSTSSRVARSPRACRWLLMRPYATGVICTPRVASAPTSPCRRPCKTPSTPVQANGSQGRQSPSKDLKAVATAASKARMTALAEMTQDSDRDVRLVALNALGRFGERAQKHVSTIMWLLGDDDRIVRRAAADVLDQVGETERLEEMLDAQDWKTRTAAGDAISVFGADLSPFAPKLATVIREDENHQARAAAAKALGSMGAIAAPQVRALAYALKNDPCLDVRAAAASALAQVGPAGHAHAELLVQACEDTKLPRKKGKLAAEEQDNAGSRELILATIGALTQMGPAATSLRCTTALATHLRSHDQHLRLAAVRGLAKLDEGKLLAELLLDTHGRVHETVAEARCSIYADGMLQAPQQSISSFPEVMFTDEIRDARRLAAERLGNLGQTAAPHAGALVSALKSYHRQVRCAAAEALGHVGAASSAGHVNALAAALKDEAHTVRRKAAEALGRLGNGQMLAELLTHRDAEMREAAARGLGVVPTIGKQYVDALVDVLTKDRDMNVRRAVMEVLHQLGGSVNSFGAFAYSKALKDGDPYVRQVAAELLRAADDDVAAPHAKDFAEALQAGDKFVCSVAEDVLGKIGEAASATAGTIVGTMEDPSQEFEVRVKAAEILGKIGKVDILADFLADEARDLREVALRGLARNGEGALPFVKRISALLKDEDPNLRRMAQSLLIKLGEAAAPHSATIEDMLKEKDTSREVRLSAARILAQIGKTDLLAEQLQPHKNAEVKHAAVHGLGSCVKASHAHTASLMEALKDDDESVRMTAMEALAKPNVIGQTQVVALTDMLRAHRAKNARDEAVRRSAAVVLGNVGQSKELAKLLHSSDWWLRQAACFGFGALGEAAQGHADEIVEALKDDHKEVVVAANLALGRIFPRRRAQQKGRCQGLKHPSRFRGSRIGAMM